MHQLPLIEDTSYRDTAFADNKKLPFHGWVNWIAGFSSTFVTQALERYLPESSGEQLVLDPFGGVGTTPITAYLRGHAVVTFEINPFPALVTEVKLRAINELEPHCLQQTIKSFLSHMAKDLEPQSKPPAGFRTRVPFYSIKVLRKVLQTWDFIQALEDPLVRDIFRVAFGATMVSFSNYTYEPSLTSRPGAGKSLIVDADVAGILSEKLHRICQDLILIHRKSPPLIRPTWQVINTSFLEAKLPPQSVDILITSPPYLNNYHYARNTRPQLYWLGFVRSPADLRYLEENNYGKYWQTVREESYECALLIDSPWLRSILEEIQTVDQDRKVYGGTGWSNYACEYFNDTCRFLKTVHDVLKPGSYALVVVGNSILKGVDVPVDRVFTHIADQIGFSHSEINVVRDTRVGSSIVGTGLRTGIEKRKLYEVVVEIRR